MAALQADADARTYACACAGQSSVQGFAANTSTWMMVPDSMVSVDGTECNQVGTSYWAFNFQPVCLPLCTMPLPCSHGVFHSLLISSYHR